MAYRGHDPSTVYGVSIGLLALGSTLFYGWALVPAEHQAQVWNICGATARVALLCFVLRYVPSWWVLAVGLWWTAEEMMVIGCSVAYIVKPWEIPDGQAQCSSLLGADIGKAGIAIVSGLALLLTFVGPTKRNDS